LIPLRRRPNNFGDLLGPLLVKRIVDRFGDSTSSGPRRNLLTIGSIIRLASDGDVVWGSGANGKSLNGAFPFASLDVRAVRGPLTREILLRRGIAVPEVFGDPGLLVSQFWPEIQSSSDSRSGVVVIPNLHDVKLYKATVKSFVDPRSDLEGILRKIAGAELVVGSSLHAIVIAESFGVPARLVQPTTEPPFKYQDYYEGTGRSTFEAGGDTAEAIRLGGEAPPIWDPAPLLEAFPRDLWRGHGAGG
jgi:pyruvyltransferase